MTDDKIAEIGTLLKQRREQLGYSLQDAAQHTRIRLVFLESIENNRFSELPGQAYVTGFIRVYANYLGLDSEPLLAKLDDLPLGTGTSSVKYIPVAKHKPSRSRKTSAKQAPGTLLVALLAILLVVAVVYYLPDQFRDKTTVEPVPSQIEPAPSQIEPAQEAAPVSAEPVASSLNAGVDAIPGDGPEAKASVKTEVGETLPLKEDSPAQVTDVTASAVTGRFPPVAVNGSSLRMLALTKSRLLIYVDNRSPQEYKLHDGLDLTWKVKKRVKVELADVGSARFWLDGQELDLAELSAFQLQTSTGD